ncbi:glucose-1-phosphate thymidylyltransferase [Streptomyces benahoarensis]|uniref:Glucose-1-phosphate thymidylyltransferase n=1 Tax=Streptomyces benahoarensis TaxID=2595054 RepID=A0A553ZL91_9ACTN|nr:glucose-1-phosphate thymidylyltransferase [Streptomyces benahoarensis]TSB22380.1 glucose-1-phosphate thymidylyltransferase [Streptomyces benahoarensis]TSB42197.1 glucose-1-phosphate thymidylyltransferase [Streptomyces benahoarensis]
MKALVLSGGSGTRLRPFSHSMPKQLIPIVNKPVLEHVLGNIRDLGVTEVGIVVGSWAAEIAEVVGDGSRLGIRVTYLPQEQPLGLAHCVSLARTFLGDDDFVMYLGDNMLPEGIAQAADEFRAQRPAAAVVVHQVADPRAFGVVELEPDGTVARLVEKPPHPRSNLALIGVYFFTPAIHEAVRSIKPSARGELEITDALQWLVENGFRIKADEYRGYWKDTGQAADILDCNERLLADLRPGNLGSVDAASQLGDRVRIEAGARIVRSRIDSPAVIGAGTVIEDCHIGPNTSIGSGCTLRATRVRDSIVMDGAEIAHGPGLRNSLIGRNAVIGAGLAGAACHTLVVGDHTRIRVAA